MLRAPPPPPRPWRSGDVNRDRTSCRALPPPLRSAPSSASPSARRGVLRLPAISVAEEATAVVIVVAATVVVATAAAVVVTIGARRGGDAAGTEVAMGKQADGTGGVVRGLQGANVTVVRGAAGVADAAVGAAA